MHRVRAGGLVAVVLAVTVTAGCGEAEHGPDQLVTVGEAPATPYSGPLWVPVKEMDGEEGAGQAAVKAASGAAGRALECEGDIDRGGEGEIWSKQDGGRTPEEGLEAYFEIEQPGLPEYGYRVEREEAERVLFSFDVDG
ncbi:hypothetical protein U9R90_35400 [Streptomyces sp. E11-3]|uniref:hypothetical protein n=1 Tax=Streptomyces sp. E11-3 TaxID=3110112 RepID=UPI00397FC711